MPSRASDPHRPPRTRLLRSRLRKGWLAFLLIGAAVIAGWLSTAWLDGPWGMLPGGRLVGAESDCATARWDDYAAIREVEVETGPARPRSVTTWSVVHAGELFVPADFLTPWKRWPHQVLEDDRVRIRIAAEIFACRAERIVDAELIAQLRGATAAKYGLQPGGRAATIEVWWFRISPR